MTKQIHCIGRKRRCYRRPKSQAALMQPRATFCDSSGNLHRVFSTLKLFFLLMFSKYPQFDILHQISKVLEVVKWSPHHQGTFAETLLSTAGNTSHSLLAVGALAGLIGSSGSSWVHPPQENIVFQHISSWCCVAWLLAGSTFGYSSENITGLVLLTMNLTIKRQSIMFLGPANAYDLDQRHNRPDKRGLLPFSHCLQPQPGKKLQPGKQPQPGKKKLNQVYKSKPSTIQ